LCIGLKSGAVNKPQTLTIDTCGAGEGDAGPTEPKIGCVDNHDGTLTVENLPSSVGSHEIAVSFANQPVPGLIPFTPASQLTEVERTFVYSAS